MTGSIGFPAGVTISYNGKPQSAAEKLSKDASGDALATERDAGKLRIAGSQTTDGTQEADAGQSSGNVIVDMLLKRMQELRELMQQQQQQLAAAQAAAYPTPEAKTTVVMGIQSQIASTSAALQQTSAQLVKELSKGAAAGSLISTTA
ncbi:hypothetical protein SAMN04487857_102403 [Pseudomonas sp. ok272]|nr:MULTISPECIES: hypothetical protein [unclassified Pseudomonas]SEM51744.1 hypothetical protein SAMN04487857_102403 [Pseudomonas sp. ok272]SFM23550.1 hypothetical protein SAMN04487858_101404 [Pseudomonas sp. ok602]